MVKQGRFAKSSKLRQIKQIRHHMHHQAGRIISPDQFEEFVLVRYGLTLKKKYYGIAKETMQRFLMEVIHTAGPTINPWPLTTIITETFKNIGVRVPYQFYRVVFENWAPFEQFLKREIPAVPLKARLFLTATVSKEQLSQIIGRQLAANTLMTTGNRQIIEQVKPEQLDSLVAQFMIEGVINWQRVAQIFAPIPFDTSTAPDETTKQWLEQLKEWQ